MAIESSRALAVEAISAAVAALRLQGHEVAACGVLLGAGRTLPTLEKILAAHPLLHTAEGEMFRDVLVAAARECGLPVLGTREKELDAASLQSIQSLGKLIAPPYRTAVIAPARIAGAHNSNGVTGFRADLRLSQGGRNLPRPVIVLPVKEFADRRSEGLRNGRPIGYNR